MNRGHLITALGVLIIGYVFYWWYESGFYFDLAEIFSQEADRKDRGSVIGYTLLIGVATLLYGVFEIVVRKK